MMGFFNAGGLIGKGSAYEIDGLEKPVVIVGLSGAGVEALQSISAENNVSPVRLYAWLIKQCCPQFKWWSMSRICKQLPVAVSKRLADKCMEVSSVDGAAVDRAKKNSESDT